MTIIEPTIADKAKAEYLKYRSAKMAKISKAVAEALEAVELEVIKQAKLGNHQAKIEITDDLIASTGNANSVKRGDAGDAFIKALSDQGLKGEMSFGHDGGGRRSWITLTVKGWL